ncbi:hypothetical protein [Streptomyces venezuelae]|uniref:hypothetical protein n=1 Tax=Streptomyces venezuelae TaxID=54571 RepID=UPI003418525C
MAGLDGASDAVRLAVLVLVSRTPSETGVVEIRTSELGRWLGLSASHTASVVVPGLRRSGVVSVNTAKGNYGQDDGLECKVLPLWAAQDVVGHPLNLAKKEYATLWRLMEAVMAPGWTHRDGSITPAGLIGTRTGRGAATDRLALLLLVLEARETGRVRQCGGAVDSRRGRAATTVARLLGCTASTGERVLERLEDRELVLRVRLKTGSGLANRSRLMVPAVAAAHGRTVADDLQEDRMEALEPEFSDPDDAEGPGETTATEKEPQVNGVPVTDEADVAEPDVAASLHTDHPSLVTPVGSLQLSCGFSGEGRGGKGRRPERVCVREDQAVDGVDSAARTVASVAKVSTLRGKANNLVSSFVDVFLSPVLARQVPQVSTLLGEIVPVASAFQRHRLGRLVQGLLLEGESDAEIAARLRARLAPLATGDPKRPYAFRRDGLSWALSVGLPYVRGGLTLVPCARGGCRQFVRGRATDRVRCDACEMAARDETQATAARRAWELANAVTSRPDTPSQQAPSPCQDLPDVSLLRTVPAARQLGPASAPEPRKAAPHLPGPVRDILEGLAAIAPQDVLTAERAAHVLYIDDAALPGAKDTAGQRRKAAATAAWQAVVTRYADQLAARHARESA